MTNLPADPIAPLGLDGFATAFRKGEMTSEAVTRAYLERIATLDPQLGSYQYIAAEQALKTAQAMDQLREAGLDLGPLMGVPVAVKDLLVVDGMPTTGGSKLELRDLMGQEEGPFVRALRQAGCVILGKTKMVEFALGITGVSESRGTPWNPWDLETHRLPGGSSSGSGVAAAAGLCAFSIGSDTGGSVRVPAALNGLFGLKTTFGLWSNDGSLALAPHLDTLGLLTRTARDAAIAFAALNQAMGMPEEDPRCQMAQPARLPSLLFGRPENYFFEDLAPDVADAMDTALDQLSRTGVALQDMTLPEAPEREDYFPVSLPVSLLASLGRKRFLDNKHLIDPVIAGRIEGALEVKAIDHVALENRREESIVSAHARFDGLDGWISPTTASKALPVTDLSDPKTGLAFALSMTRNTQPGNYLELCAATIPLPRQDGGLPIGFQVMCPADSEADLLSISLALEETFGPAAQPDMGEAQD
ncbi:amidase [Fodinicurvata fenggangensis]|uniref:amidase n=1 Tax=Fodinicurvata fenggangensis TaxID=1121830 RepID=UPI00054E1D00|nr:amidase [Fodinicurvata fenggangensis]